MEKTAIKLRGLPSTLTQVTQEVRAFRSFGIPVEFIHCGSSHGIRILEGAEDCSPNPDGTAGDLLATWRTK